MLLLMVSDDDCGMNECGDGPAYDRAKLVKNQQLLGEAGVAGALVAVLKTHLQSAAVMEQACSAAYNLLFNRNYIRCPVGNEKMLTSN